MQRAWLCYRHTVSKVGFELVSHLMAAAPFMTSCCFPQGPWLRNKYVPSVSRRQETAPGPPGVPSKQVPPNSASDGHERTLNTGKTLALLVSSLSFLCSEGQASCSCRKRLVGAGRSLSLPGSPLSQISYVPQESRCLLPGHPLDKMKLPRQHISCGSVFLKCKVLALNWLNLETAWVREPQFLLCHLRTLRGCFLRREIQIMSTSSRPREFLVKSSFGSLFSGPATV